MLAIKLKRIGKKHQPAYRVVVQEKRTKLNGLYTEDLGWFNPLLNKREIKKDRVLHWISVGAKPTPTVHNILVSDGIINGPKIPVHKVPKKTEAELKAEATEVASVSEIEKKTEEVKAEPPAEEASHEEIKQEEPPSEEVKEEKPDQNPADNETSEESSEEKPNE